MAKTKTLARKKPILTDESMQFFRRYINNASPVGFETWGQKLWLEYLKPYVDEYYVDPYGTTMRVQRRLAGEEIYGTDGVAVSTLPGATHAESCRGFMRFPADPA